LPNLVTQVVDEARAYRVSLGQLSRNARRYLWMAVLLAAGLGVQTVIYNLYLVELGYREDLVGQVAAAHALGVALGGLPAGLFYSRVGGKTAFAVAVVSGVLSMGLRALSTQPAWLIVWAAVNGLANSILFVSIFPFITDQSTPRERPHLYGLNQAIWNGLMVLGAFVSGYLPTFWRWGLPATDDLSAYRLTLLTAALLSGLAVLPVLLMQADMATSRQRARLLPSAEGGRAIASGAVVLAMTGLVIGLVQPFYNTYFHSVFDANPSLIGTLISLSQIAAMLSALAVPVVVRRTGLVLGPAVTSITGAVLTLAMGLRLPLLLVAVFFLLRVALEWLAQTPLMNLIMVIVNPADRGAMSGVRLVTNYGAQALAGAVGGWVVVNAGYTWLFALAAGLQLITGVGVWVLFNAQRVALEAT
jgi:MFS family permease